MSSALTGRLAAEEPGRSRRLVDLIFRAREFGIIAVLAIFVGVTTAIQPRFLDDQNIKFVLLNTTIFALLASIDEAIGLKSLVSSGYTLNTAVLKPRAFRYFWMPVTIGSLNGVVIAA